MSITPFCVRSVWRLTLYTKKGGNALFNCKLPKNEGLEIKNR